MKKLFSLMLLLACTIALVAQSSNNQDEVVKIDRWNQNAYRQGEVIVKFKADGAVQMRKNAKGKFQTASISQVDALFEELGVEEVEELMPNVGARKAPRRMRAYNGTEVKDHDLSKLYLVRFNEQVAAPMSNAGEMRTVHQVVEKLQALEEVEFAEPNYIVYALSTDINCDKYDKEPLYTQQWGPAAIGLPSIWNKPLVTDKRPVIAIIDTGVDCEHPDLKDNLWVNEAEKNGVTGKDDDGNGIVDDIHGYDFVNQTGGMADFNGHGTHCAGIAAAVGHNGIGITGANPDALIMPITVMQSDGTGDVATIIKGIDYAAANGANVISMSLGGYGYSIAEEQALGKAYATAVIVAAAGNDGHDLTGYHCIQDAPMFPAAFQFVLGVEASDKQGNLASFSNFDCDGPIYSEYSSETQLYNYELRAPGISVVSTFPKGQYRAMNGTSMACPLAAGAISRLLMHKEYNSWDILFGDLIHTRTNGTGNIDIKAAYNITDKDRKPTLSLVTYHIVDSIGGDNDGRPDAGDTIAIYPVLRNDWGNAENIKVWMELAEFENDTIITFLEQEVDFGKPLSSYAKNKSLNPIRFVIDKNVVDGRHISMVLKATCDNMEGILKQEIILTAENGVEIGGLISEDLTLYAGVHYIVTKSIAIPKGVTLTIKPGAVLKFKKSVGLRNEGRLIAKGTPDSMIVFTAADHLENARIGEFRFNYDTISYISLQDMLFDHNAFQYGYIENSAFKNLYNDDGGSLVNYICLNRCNLELNDFNTLLSFNWGTTAFTNIISNNSNNPFNLYRNKDVHMICCNSFNNQCSYYECYYSASQISDYIGIHQSSNPSYLGSSKESILYNNILDANSGYGYCYVDLDYVAKEPIREAHGIVWKVVVNGYDAQDEFEMLPPLGVGKHKFEVYFNRPMDTSVAPNISMGVRAPYTQNAISEDGSWSADSTIYTAYLTITGKTASDGLNRIYVYGAEDDEHFEIPEENMRFNVQVAAAGSLSTGLMAEPGLGKVSLQWQTDEEDFEDLLGYNIYRWTEIEDSMYVEYDENWNWIGEWQHFIRRDTICINQSVIDAQEDTFVDYDVVPGKTYYYYIKQLTTSLASYDLSNAVAATPLTAQKGDANGSMNVDVADVVTEVAYLTGGNPQPFIFEAADVNSDTKINILDIVGTVNIIKNPAASSLGFSDNNTATYSIEDGILYVETPVVLGGVQFAFNADAEISVLEALKGFETTTWTTTDNFHFMAYSMSGKVLEVGKHALLDVGDATLENIVLSNAQGQNVPAIKKTPTSLSSVEAMQMRLPNPNPFTTMMNIPYVVGQSGKHKVRLVFTNVAGMTVDSYSATQTFGEYTYTWRPAGLPEGVYFVTLYVDGKKMQSSKLVKVN
ncbi:MAG: S8 family serine peptidase [Paludibacteraceae bacterium]|nr:S8 family serine peptidase [Paludibacteraceae bacterium]